MSRLHLVQDPAAAVPEIIIRTLGADPDALVRDGLMLKDGDRSTVVRLDGEAGSFVLKRYNRKGLVHTMTHTVLRSRAAWCWRNGRRLRAAGLRTPRPIAAAERRIGPLRFESFLLTEFIPGEELRSVVARSAAGELERCVDELAGIWSGLATLRAGHDDMKAANFIVDGNGHVWMIDLDGMRLGLPGPMYRRARRLDHACFMRNWREHAEAAAIFGARMT